MAALEITNPPSLRPPSGFSHGLHSRGGRLLFIAGQTAGSSGDIPSDDMVEQFDQALANVLEVVRAAGGVPQDLATLTIFVTDMNAYRVARRALGPRYRARMGSHYPAIALVEVTSLFNPKARVEIQGIAVLGD